MRKYCLFTCLFFSSLLSAQGFRAFNNHVDPILTGQGKTHDLFKMSLITGIKKGTSVGLSYGLWKENSFLQTSLNTGFMWRMGKGFLGNYRKGSDLKDSRTRSQFVFMFSPLLTARLFNKNYVYQEIEPFYLGTPNAVFCRYNTHITLGTTFTICPRGTYHNMMTTRNRAQQVFMISLNVHKFNFTIYDDYFPLFTEKLQLGDNWDRFFTGGGFIRYRFNSRYTFHLYSEVYTGINRSNPFLHPDLISYHPKRGRWREKNYAHQDPGQEYFNSSWLIADLSYTSSQAIGNSTGFYTPDFHFMVGSSAPWTMFSQNLIHSFIKYDKANDLKLHYFIPRTRIPGNLEAGGKTKWRTNFKSIFFGAGIGYNMR